MSDPVLTLRDLATIECKGEQEEIANIMRADTHAAELVVGGVLMGQDAPFARLEAAIDRYTDERPCDCLNCERAFEVSLARSSAAYYIGLAVGLRLARATDAGGAS